MHELYFDNLQETLYSETLDNGLSVYILPKKGFSKTYVTFTTQYGSIDRSFIPFGKTDKVTVPDGIAHFLEHKMFEKEDGDVFQKFSVLGGAANAFTSFTRTAYLFSATNRIYENTKTLVDFVQTPYFTEETVEKEKGIIAQEITMYDDLPDWRLYFGTIENLYHNHPVRIDIAGTVQSIDDITAAHLYECYETFYHPSNMAIFIVGAVNPQEMMTFIKENQEAKRFQTPEEITRFYPDEPKSVWKESRTIEMDVLKTKLSFGMKCSEVEGQGAEMLKQELATDLAMDLLFGRSTSFYEKMYEQSVIDESYSYGFSLEKGFGFAMISSDTNHPEKFEQAIRLTIESQQAEWSIGEEQMERLKKRKIGQFMRSLNSIEFIANHFPRYQFNGMDLFEVVPTLEALTMKDLQNAFATIADHQSHTVFKVVPPEQRQ